MDDHIAKYIESFPGLRFHPRDEELMLTLKAMILGTYDTHHGFIFQFNVCQHEPWELAGLIDERTRYKFNSREWYCFNRQTSKYGNSKRCDRTTGSGYWKSTGKKRDIVSDVNEVMGFKQTLVFYEGRIPNGIRTGWIMYEYHLNTDFLGDYNFNGSMPFVVCRMKYKKDKKEAEANSSTHQDDHINNTNNTPITIESEFDEEPVSLVTTPTAPTSQLAENAWSPVTVSEKFLAESAKLIDMGLPEGVWESLPDIPMAPSSYYTGCWENPYDTCLEEDNLWN